MRSQDPIDVAIVIGEEMVESQTRLTSGGPYVSMVSSVIPSHGIELHSSYVGSPGRRSAEDGRTPPTRSTHLMVGDLPDLPTTCTYVHDREDLPVVFARRRCVLDHAARLADLCRQVGHDHVAIDIDDRALLLANRP